MVVENEPAYLTDAFAEEAIAFIKRSSNSAPEGASASVSDEARSAPREPRWPRQRGLTRKADAPSPPWFLYLAFNAVHVPMEATEEYESRFPHIKDKKRRTLAGMLAAMDDAVGDVMATIRELGAEENTLVLFYSDNGGIPPKNASLNGPLRGMKSTMFEGGVRVPFLAQWKGIIPPGKVYKNPVMGFDCHATALAAAGLDLDNGAAPPLDGVDLLPFLTGKNEGRPHGALYWRAGNQHAARIGDHKIVTQRGSGTMLFNLAEDLGEANDLAASNPENCLNSPRPSTPGATP